MFNISMTMKGETNVVHTMCNNGSCLSGRYHWVVTNSEPVPMKRGHIIAYLGLANLCVWLVILYQFNLIG
jgi:hypothetical protein